MSKQVNEVTITKSTKQRYAQMLRASISGMLSCELEDVIEFEKFEDNFEHARQEFLSACHDTMYSNPARG